MGPAALFYIGCWRKEKRREKERRKGEGKGREERKGEEEAVINLFFFKAPFI